MAGIKKEKLIEMDLNSINVIQDWMGIPLIKTEKKSTTNQMVFKEFRTFLNEASMSYYTKHENKKKFEEDAAKKWDRTQKTTNINQNIKINDDNDEQIEEVITL